MPRERAKLSEKQERILVQAQLMGLNERDMVQIGNRLVALKKEKEMKQMVAETIEGFSWEPIGTNNKAWLIKTDKGFEIEAVKGSKNKVSYMGYGYHWKFTVSKPGTRFKPREFDEHLQLDLDWKKSLMPDNNKDLFGVLHYIKRNINRIQNA